MARMNSQNDMHRKSIPLKVLSYVWSFRGALTVVLIPAIFSLLFVFAEPTPQMKCLYTVLVMAAYWVTEVLPLPVTALLPLVMYPLLGVVKSADVARTFMTPLKKATALINHARDSQHFEEADTSQQVGLQGSAPEKYHNKLYITTNAEESMELETKQSDEEAFSSARSENSSSKSPEFAPLNSAQLRDERPAKDEIKLSPESLSSEESRLCKMMLLSACYASSIGGVGTLTGTPPNIIVFGYMEKTYGKDTGLTYLSWLLYAVPIVILNAIGAWLILTIYFLGFRRLFKKAKKCGNVKEVIQVQYNTLGRMSFQEWEVAILFIVLILLWVFHSPQFIKGWGDMFKPGFVTGATPAIFMACLMFVLPSQVPDFSCHFRSGKPRKVQPPLMTWKYLQAKFPWDMIILIGGSFGMAEGISASGLSKDVDNYMSQLKSLAPWQLCFIAVLLASAATEFTSNAAMATILTPILCAAAVELRVNPLYLALTGAVGVSYAFMLPIGTPANAIVFAAGVVTVTDMVKVGFFMNIITALVTVLASNSWGWWMFNFSTFPAWTGTSLVGSTTVNATQIMHSTFPPILSNSTA